MDLPTHHPLTTKENAMAHKRIEDGMIHTTNGVDTLTAPIYVRELRTFEPLPNGFNRDLATYVVDWIEDNKALWDQHSWRVLFELDEEHADFEDQVWVERKAKDRQNPRGRDSIQAALTKLARQIEATENPTCGTAMCMAGWVGELTGVDWVIDRKLLRESRVQLPGSLATKLAEQVIVPGMTMMHGRATPENWYDPHYLGTISNPVIIEHLRLRGFSPATHHMEHVRSYAMRQLGLLGEHTAYHEMPVLFEGANTIEDLRAVIEHHTVHGPFATLVEEQLPSRQPGGVNYDSDDDGDSDDD